MRRVIPECTVRHWHNSLENHRFISPEIKRDVIANYLSGVECRPDKHTIIYYFFQDNATGDARDVKDVAKTVAWFRAITGYAGSIILIIFPTKHLKQLPAANTPITESHVNSGSTVMKPEERISWVWRAEEMDRVILHELLHQSGIIQHKAHDANKAGYYDRKDVEEAQTELLAEQLYWRMHSQSDNEYRRHMKRQREYSLKQLAAIIRHCGMDVNGDYKEINRELSARTCIFGYYWLKTAWLFGRDPRDTLFKDMVCQKLNKNECESSLRMIYTDKPWASKI